MKNSYPIFRLIDKAIVAGTVDFESDTLKRAMEKGLSVIKGEDWKINEIYDLKRNGANELIAKMEIVPSRDPETRKAEQDRKVEELLQQLGTSVSEIKKSFKTDAEFWNMQWRPRFGEVYHRFMVGKTYKKLLSMALGRQNFNLSLAKKMVTAWKDWQDGIEPEENDAFQKYLANGGK